MVSAFCREILTSCQQKCGSSPHPPMLAYQAFPSRSPSRRSVRASVRTHTRPSLPILAYQAFPPRSPSRRSVRASVRTHTRPSLPALGSQAFPPRSPSRRSVRASVRTYTRPAPASMSVRRHWATVVPVVRTSSISRTVSPCSASRARIASLSACLRASPLCLACCRVSRARRSTFRYGKPAQAANARASRAA